MSPLHLNQVGKEFDALLVDTSAPKEDPVFDVFDKDSMEVRVCQSITGI